MSRLGRSYPVRRVFRQPRFLPAPLPPISFDAIGVGDGGNTRSLSWTHTVNPAATGITVFGCISTQAGISISATAGGVAMTSFIANPGLQCYISSPNRLYLYALGLVNPPTGNITVAVSLGGGSAVFYGQATSASYFGVSSFGTPVTNTGNAPTASIPASSSFYIVGMSENATGATTFTSLSGGWTSRWNPGPSSVYSNARALLVGDGTGPATFSATATGDWGAVAIPVS